MAAMSSTLVLGATGKTGRRAAARLRLRGVTAASAVPPAVPGPVHEFVARAEADAPHVTAMFALIDRGLLAGTHGGAAALPGRAPRTFEDYVLRAAAAGAWRPTPLPEGAR